MNKNVFHPSNGVRCFYVRDRHDNPVGLVMTRQTPDGPQMGWSLCKRREDTFRKLDAKVVAFDRLAPVPSVTLPEGLRDTPMNRALSVLSADMTAPQTVRSAAKREVQRRLEAGPSSLPPVEPCYGLSSSWPGNPNAQQTVTAAPLPEKPSGLFARVRRTFGL